MPNDEGGRAPLRGVTYALLRRVDFRGKARLRALLRVPASGRRVVRYPGGLVLELDLREHHQRDVYFGLYERRELEVVRHVIGADGDMVDVGAHIGMFSITAARAARDGSRVLALEPNPRACAQLRSNVELNGCENVVVVEAAATDRRGRRSLFVPVTPDPSWSSLERREFASGPAVEVQTTTVDAEVGERAFRPAFLKIDVEGHELRVLAGSQQTLEAHRPLVLCEVSETTAEAAAAFFARIGYTPVRVLPRKHEHGLGPLGGIFNVFFVPDGGRLPVRISPQRPRPAAVSSAGV